MPRICLITGAPLCRNPRVVKEASALSEAGYDVKVLGPVFTDEVARQDEQILDSVSWQRIVTADLRSSQAPVWRRLWWRGVRRLATEACYRLNWETPYGLGYGLRRTLHRARQVEADLYIGHQETGAWVATQLLREGHCVGADFEDWYARDLLPEAQATRPIELLETCEAALLKHSAHATTTSHALASALADRYDAPKPAVVYNAFPWSDRDNLDGQYHDRDNTERPSLHWFSQTIGPGRGLDTLCKALRRVDCPVDVHLRGNVSSDFEAHLSNSFPDEFREHRLFLHDLVHPTELMSRIAEHDIGLALEQPRPPSRNLTITNKILQYVLGGLAVIATPTTGQMEVADATPESVFLCEGYDADSLAAKIQDLAVSSKRLHNAQKAALNAAEETFCWEQQVPRLVASVDRALSMPAQSSTAS